MSWVNLNDVYVNKTGGTITGDLTVNGSIKVNDGKGDGGIYNVANEITTLRDSVSQVKAVEFYELDGNSTRTWTYGGAGWYTNTGLYENVVGDYSDFMTLNKRTMTIKRSGRYAFFLQQGFITSGKQVGCGIFVNGSERKTVAFVPSNDRILQCITLAYVTSLNVGDVVEPKAYSQNAALAVARAFTSLCVVSF